MELSNVVIIVALVACGLYLIWSKFRKDTEITSKEEPVAPYKVEPPVVEAVAPVEVKVVPELKVVTGAPKKSRPPRPRAKKATTTTTKPKAPRQPKQ